MRSFLAVGLLVLSGLGALIVGPHGHGRRSAAASTCYTLHVGPPEDPIWVTVCPPLP